MKSEKIRALLMLMISIFITAVGFRVANYYGESIAGFVSILIVIFVCCPAMIASLDILTNGLILRGFLGPMDYGFWKT